MKFLKNIRERKYLEKAKAYAEEGLKRIKDATPVDTGKTRDSWYYTIEDNGKDIKISWCNDNSADGIPIVLLIFYGHGTKNGGYVPGYDFLSPAIQPVMDKLVENVWEGVLK